MLGTAGAFGDEQPLPQRTVPHLVGRAPNICQYFDDPLTMALVVASGGGVALSGEGMSSRHPGLEYLLVEPEVVVAEISAVWLEDCRNPLLKPFLDHLGSSPVAAGSRSEALRARR